MTALNRRIAVIGLGYVGLPVAVAFGQLGRVIGFDINAQRIAALREGHDATGEVNAEPLRAADVLFTANPADLAEADFYIVAVPTPVDDQHIPDLLPVLRASKTVGAHLRRGDIVVYESTVYPGATEESCVPVLERCSGLRCGMDFSVGYSPERINPGDKNHTFTNVIKIVSGLDAATLDIIAEVYSQVVTAGVHRAASIAVAEAAKVIENTQRDVNIALMNEFSMIFDRLGIDTHDVLAAAGSKWNFLPFTPGLVGGHCIGIDPYYLVHKAERVGYSPSVIPAARVLNESMGIFVAARALEQMRVAGYLVPESTVTILGLAFKENVPDLRNTRVVDMIHYLQMHRVTVQVHDPLVDAHEAQQELGVELLPAERLAPAHCVILAVPHPAFRAAGWPWIGRLLERGQGVVVDVKGVLPRAACPPAIQLWRL